MDDNQQKQPNNGTETSDTPTNRLTGQSYTGHGVSTNTASSTASTTAVATMPTITPTATQSHIQLVLSTGQQQPIDVNQSMQQNLLLLNKNFELQYKGLESMKILMNHVQQASEKFLEWEKLRISRGQNNVANSTTLDSLVNRPILEEITNQTSNEVNLEVTKVLSESLSTLKEVIDSNKKSQNYQVHRQYELTEKGDINIWLDKIESELNSKDLLDVIEPNVTPSNLDVQIQLRRQQTAREIIVGRLDDKYYRTVIKITDPKEILHVIRESRRVEKNVTHASVRAKLYKLKLKKNSKVVEFNTLFDNIVTEYESCENAVPLTEEEKRSAYYQAISEAVPEIKASDLTHIA